MQRSIVHRPIVHRSVTYRSGMQRTRQMPLLLLLLLQREDSRQQTKKPPSHAIARSDGWQEHKTVPVGERTSRASADR